TLTSEKPSEILLTECEELDGIQRKPTKTTIVSSSSGSEYDSDEYGLEENECYSKLGDYRNENEALAVAFEHAEVSLIDLETSGLLPLIPSSESDEFCVFCSEFVIDPLPDLSCGMHDTFQQKVNQKVKEIIDQRHSSRKIDKKLVKTLISYAKMWRNECEKSVGTVEISTPDVVRKRPTHKKPTAKRTGFPTFNNDGPRSSSLSSTSSSITTVYDDNPKKKLKKKRSFNASDTSSSSEPCRKRRMTPSRGLLREIEVEKAEERLKIAARALIDTFYPTPISTVFLSRISFWASSYEAQQFDVFKNSENFKNFGSSSRERTPKKSKFVLLKSLNIGVSRLYMDMRNIKFNIEKFGFSTGNEVLNEELEKVVARMFEDRKTEFKISRLISQMGPTAYKLLQKSRNRVQVEREIIEKIMEKSLAVFEKSPTPVSKLLITAIDKVRKAAGVLPISISTPNLVLASHMADVPMTSHIFMHWNRPVFSENTTLKFEPIKNVL
uniref:Uncharacterized protein n=1 Tax=Caenorhabditis japonica TaxID=281687 RepID=A0A8R1HXD7_CAEJA